MNNQPIFGTFEGTVDEKLCFVLMPFSQKFDELYVDSIKKIVEKNQLQCVRADDIYSTNPIIEDIWNSINKARIIISDLTGKNPNVFYETGIAHTLGKEVVLLTQKLSDVPFDLRHLRVIVYEFTPRGATKLEVDLENAINSIFKKTLKVIPKIQAKISTDSEILTESISLLKEKSVIESGENYLLYEIHTIKNSMITGYVASDNVIEVGLVDVKNKELFEANKMYRGIIESIDVVRYNFHFRSESDAILYLLIKTMHKDKANVDINLQLEPLLEQNVVIIWDEESIQTSNNSMAFYNFDAHKDDVVKIDIESSLSNYDIDVSENPISSQYDLELTPEKLYSEENIRSSHLKIKCPKTGSYTALIQLKLGEKTKLKSVISIIRSN